MCAEKFLSLLKKCLSRDRGGQPKSSTSENIEQAAIDTTNGHTESKTMCCSICSKTRCGKSDIHRASSSVHTTQEPWVSKESSVTRSLMALTCGCYSKPPPTSDKHPPLELCDKTVSRSHGCTNRNASRFTPPFGDPVQHVSKILPSRKFYVCF